jgi:hypothetical protein
MSFNFLNDRDMRQLQEAADIHAQLQRFDIQAHLYDIHEALEWQRRMEKDLRLLRDDALRELQDAVHLHEMFDVNYLDIQRTIHEALDQHERLRDALGNEAFESVTELAEQASRASLDMNRMAQISEQLSPEYLAKTLRRAQELISGTAITYILSQTDIQTLIREAEAAMDAALSEPGEFTGELAGEPPEWMRHLSRENLLALIKLLILYIQTIYAGYGVWLASSDGRLSETEVGAVVQILLTALGWAYYLLDNRKDDD